jgi:hypothetical protein
LCGYPRFLYGGFWFSLVDPWPEYWAEDWYETDDVYIAYHAFDKRQSSGGMTGTGHDLALNRRPNSLTRTEPFAAFGTQMNCCF